MEFSEVVRRRRMVRTYDPDRPVPRETLEMLLKLAIRAPSAGHTQGREFLVLDDITSRDVFWSVTREAGPADSWLTGMKSAPTLVLCLSDRQAYLDRYAEPDKRRDDRTEPRWTVPYWDVDTGMAAMVLLLAAEDAGLAACLFGVDASRHDAVKDAFGVPTSLTVVAVVSLGYAAPDRRSPSLRRGRRPLADQLHYGGFRRPTVDAPDRRSGQA